MPVSYNAFFPWHLTVNYLQEQLYPRYEFVTKVSAIPIYDNASRSTLKLWLSRVPTKSKLNYAA